MAAFAKVVIIAWVYNFFLSLLTIDLAGMNKRVFLIVVFGFFTIHLFAQGSYVDSLKQWISTHPKVDSQYIQTLHRISYRLSEKNVEQAFYYYQKAQALSDSLNFTFGKSLAQINLGILLSSSANFDASNQAFFKAIDYAEKCGSLLLKSVSLNNIGDNFLSLRNFEKCREYTTMAIPVNISLKRDYGLAINYELLFRCDFEEGYYESAKNNLTKGMSYALKANDSYVYAQYFLGFGKLQALDHRFDSAKYYFDKAMAEALIQNDVRNKFYVYLAEGRRMDNLPARQRIQYLDTALNIARNTKFFEGVSKASESLSMLYDKIGRGDSALAYFRIYKNAFDSLFSENNSLNVAIKESEWQVKKKEIENQHLLSVAELQNKQLIFRNILLLALFTLLIAAVIIGFFINKSIQSKKKRIESALKQKIAESQIQSLRAQMNPHFIFNSLNSIENFMMQNEKRKASDYLHKFALLIRSILESSRNEITTVAQDMEALKLYIDLEQMRFSHSFTYKENIDPQLLSGDYNVPSLLIQPYVENAIVHGLAHSHKKDLQLTVTATLENNFIKYTVEDNGVGRSKAADYNKINKLHHKSIGLKITEDRIRLFNHEENLNGHVKITDLYDKHNKPDGTRVEVKLKVT